LDAPPTVALPGERPQMPQRVAGRPEAQCGELTLHGLGPERERLGVIGGDRVEERTVEELLVQSPDPAAYGPEFGAEGSGRRAARASQRYPSASSSGGSRCVRLYRWSWSRCSSRRRNSYAETRSAPSSRAMYPPRRSARSASTVLATRSSTSVRP